MIWILTFMFSGDHDERALSDPKEIVTEICDELAIPSDLRLERIKDSISAHAHAIDVEVIFEGGTRRHPVNVYDVVDASASNHARMALELRLRETLTHS